MNLIIHYNLNCFFKFALKFTNFNYNSNYSDHQTVINNTDKENNETYKTNLILDDNKIIAESTTATIDYLQKELDQIISDPENKIFFYEN